MHTGRRQSDYSGRKAKMGNAILVVDDERNFRTGIQFFLEENGYATDLAATGSEALSRLKESHYKAVLLDLVLPDVEGMELAEYITANHPETAVVILTGNGSIDSAIRAVRYGVVDYLQKPCKPELVLQILTRGIESKQLKKELIRSRHKFEQLAAATWEGIAFFCKGNLTQCNVQFCDLFGTPEPTDKTTLSLSRLIKDWQECLTLVDQVPEGEPSVFETVGFFSNGTSFPLEMRIRKINTLPEVKWVAAFRDISTRKHEEISRIKMQEELTNAQRMESIGLMAGSVAHDLNNILTAIVTFPELLLLKMESGEKYREDIDRIRKAGKQAADVVSDLLTVARGATSKKEPSNLNDIIQDYRESLDFTQFTQDNQQASIHFQLDPQLAHIEASSVHLTKTIMNLVVNGVEATNSSGMITVSTENCCLQKMKLSYEDIPAGTYVILSIKDSGPGIDKNDLPRLFEPFFSRKKLGRSGTGLGLTVVWNTIRDHRGYIDITSGTDGSCFNLYFPVCKQSVQLPPHCAFSPPPIGQGEKVLVVDDETSQLDLTSALLKRLGYSPMTVTTGEAALELLKREHVDLLLLDLWMDPGLNGYETYQKALEIHPDQKAILASGYFRQEDRDAAKSLGLQQQLTKPYSIQNLAYALREEIESNMK